MEVGIQLGSSIIHFTAHSFKTSPHKMSFRGNENVLEPDTGNGCTVLCTKCYFKAVHGMFCECHPTVKQKPNTSPPDLPSSTAQTPSPQSFALFQAGHRAPAPRSGVPTLAYTKASRAPTLWGLARNRSTFYKGQSEEKCDISLCSRDSGEEGQGVRDMHGEVTILRSQWQLCHPIPYITGPP